MSDANKRANALAFLSACFAAHSVYAQASVYCPVIPPSAATSKVDRAPLRAMVEFMA